MAGFRSMFAAYLREQAQWRETKAEEYPDDERNARCAQALGLLAAHVESEPDAHPALLALESMNLHSGTGVFSPSEEGGRMISRFGFDRPPRGLGWPIPDFDQFLDDLAVVETRDRVEREREESRGDA